MRRQSVETMGESRKRKQREVKNVSEKKANFGQKTFNIIQEKVSVDSGFQRNFMLKEKEIEEKAKHREII